MKRFSQKTIVKPTTEELDAAVNTLMALGYEQFGGVATITSGNEIVFFQTLRKEEDMEIGPVLNPDKPLPPVKGHIRSIILKITGDFTVNDVAKLVRLERGSSWACPELS